MKAETWIWMKDESLETSGKSVRSFPFLLFESSFSPFITNSAAGTETGPGILQKQEFSRNVPDLRIPKNSRISPRGSRGSEIKISGAGVIVHKVFNSQNHTWSPEPVRKDLSAKPGINPEHCWIQPPNQPKFLVSRGLRKRTVQVKMWMAWGQHWQP